MVDTNSKHSVLYIDDEENNLISFKSTFRREDNIYVATSGQQGLEIMEQNEILDPVNISLFGPITKVSYPYRMASLIQ